MEFTELFALFALTEPVQCWILEIFSHFFHFISTKCSPEKIENNAQKQAKY